MNNSQSIHIVMRNREKIFFDDDAWSITSKNDKGVFDILPEHINFISIIKDFVRIRKLDGKVLEFHLAQGVLKSSENSVSVFLGILSPRQVAPVSSSVQAR